MAEKSFKIYRSKDVDRRSLSKPINTNYLAKAEYNNGKTNY